MIICSIYSYFWGYQTYISLYTLYTLRGDNVVNQIPKDLNIISQNCQKKSLLTIYGYDFGFPWSEIKETKNGNNHTSVFFKSGIVIAVADPKNIDSFPKNLLNEKYIGVFGENALKNEYSFLYEMLNTTKKDISFFGETSRTIRSSILLNMKNIYLPLEAESGVYAFSGNNYRGFQFGDTTYKTRKIAINYFDENNNQIDMIIFIQNGNMAELKQEDINCIIKSIKL